MLEELLALLFEQLLLVLLHAMEPVAEGAKAGHEGDVAREVCVCQSLAVTAAAV